MTSPVICQGVSLVQPLTLYHFRLLNNGKGLYALNQTWLAYYKWYLYAYMLLVLSLKMEKKDSPSLLPDLLLTLYKK